MDIEKLINDFQVWVPFGDESEILIKHIPRDELQRLYQRTKKFKFVNHQKIEEFDSVEADKLLGRAVVKDWKGFTMCGEPFPCIPENIDTLMTKWNAFARFVNDTCLDLEFLMQQEKEKLKKNSSDTSGQG